MAGLLPLAVLLFGKRKFSKPFVLLLCVSVIATIMILITNFHKIQNAIVFDVYQICLIVLLTFFYFQNILSKPLSFITIILGAICLLSSTIELLSLGYLQMSLVIENISFIIIPILMYLSVINESNSNMSKSFILINSSLFIYKTSTFLLFFFLTDLLKNNLWYIHNFIEGLSKLLIAYALWKLPKPTHSLA